MVEKTGGCVRLDLAVDQGLCVCVAELWKMIVIQEKLCSSLGLNCSFILNADSRT